MFRFTIRELLLLTVIAAMGIGWAIRERQISDQLAGSKRWQASAEQLAIFAKTEVGWEVDWRHGAVYVEHPANEGRGGYYIFDQPSFERARQARLTKLPSD